MNGSDRKIKILVVDDHEVLRKGLIGLLHCNDMFSVIGEASDGNDALNFLEYYNVDIVLLDIEMAGMNGHETLINIKKKFPQVKVVMFTSHKEIGYSEYFTNIGADGFLVKNSSGEDIFDTIISIVDKKHSKKDLKISDLKISNMFLQTALNDIEKKIVVLLCEGCNNRIISKKLEMSENTVKYHRKNIYLKTRTKTLGELIIYAYKQGLIAVN